MARQPEKQTMLAALGPNMSALAAEKTMGTFPYNITPAQVALISCCDGARR